MKTKIILGLFMAAIIAPTAAAASGLRPDDRAGIRGVEPTVVGPVASDYREILRHIRADEVGSSSVSTRPDDRAGYRGSFVSIRQTPAPSASGDSFDFRDAALGAVAATGAILMLLGTALVVIRRRTQIAL